MLSARRIPPPQKKQNNSQPLEKTELYISEKNVIYDTIKIRTYHEKHLFYSRKVSEHKQNSQIQNIQRSLVDRRSLNGLQVNRLHYITADDVQKYMTVISLESIIKS